MTKPIFNQEIFGIDRIHRCKQDFDHALPFRHIVLDNFLDPEFAATILRHFPSLDSMKTHYTGINEKKAEDNNFEKLDRSFTTLHESLSSPQFLDWLVAVTGIEPLYTADDRLGFGLHQGGDHSFLDIHIDYNLHPVRKLQRKLNFLLFFNPHWEEGWGGCLELWDAGSQKTLQNILPLFNRAVIFECSEISYHGYSRISVPENITRKSFYQYYFSHPDKNLRYHDTMFRSMPEDSFVKKMAVPVKELLKNSVKKVLLRMGFEKFLK